MFSRSVWRHLAPTIPLVHAVGTAGNMCLPGVCRYCRFQCMTRSALALSSLLLWDIHWSFLSPPTPHSHEPSSPPRQTTSEKNIYRKQKKKCTVGTRGGSPFSLRRSASAKSVLVRPALPGTALLKILRTATSASSGLWKQLSQWCHYDKTFALIGCGRTTVATIERLHLACQITRREPPPMSIRCQNWSSCVAVITISRMPIACSRHACVSHFIRVPLSSLPLPKTTTPFSLLH